MEWRGILSAGGVVLATAAYFLQYARVGLNPFDEGFLLVTGLRVLHGQVPYRDFFSQLPPAVFYTQATLFRLFGTAVLPGRYAMVVVGALMALLLYLLACRLVASPLALLAVAAWMPWSLPSWFMPSYSWCAALGTLAALYCFVRQHEGAGRRWLWASGLLLGLTSLYKQNAGLYLLVALLVFLALFRVLCWGSRRRAMNGNAGGHPLGQALVLLLGMAVVLVPALLALGLAGALPAWWRDTVTVVLTVFPREMTIPYGPMMPPWPQSLHATEMIAWAQRFLFLLPVVVYPAALALVAAKAAVRRLERRHTHLLLLTLAGGFTWLETFPRADLIHLVYFLGPAYVVGISLARSLVRLIALRAAQRYRAALPIGAGSYGLLLLLLAPLLAVLVVGGRSAEDVRAASTTALDDVAPRAAGILVSPYEHRAIADVLGAIAARSKQRQPIFIIPWSVIFYFLADRPNPTRFDLLIPASLLPEDEPEVVRTLACQRVGLVLYQTLWDVNGKSFARNAPLLDGYVRAGYQQVEHIDGAGAYAQYDIWARARRFSTPRRGTGRTTASSSLQCVAASDPWAGRPGGPRGHSGASRQVQPFRSGSYQS